MLVNFHSPATPPILYNALHVESDSDEEAEVHDQNNRKNKNICRGEDPPSQLGDRSHHGQADKIQKAGKGGKHVCLVCLSVTLTLLNNDTPEAGRKLFISWVYGQFLGGSSGVGVGAGGMRAEDLLEKGHRARVPIIRIGPPGGSIGTPFFTTHIPNRPTFVFRVSPGPMSHKNARRSQMLKF
jgi:hypothetical protein